MPDHKVDVDLTIPDLNVKIHLSGTVALPDSAVAPGPATPPVDPSAGPLGLPDRVMGVYFPHWEPRRLKDRPAEINTVFLAFAIGAGAAGAVQFAGLNTLDRATFIADIQVLRKRGVRVVLSVGGEGSAITLTSDAHVTNLVNSVDRIYQEWSGFDGVDWDIETPVINPQFLAAASRKLKAKYGKKFAITMSFAGNVSTYKELARDLEKTGDVDFVAIQYYDYPATTAERQAAVTTRTRELVNTYGIRPEHIGVGLKFAGDPQMVWTVEGIRQMWERMRIEFPVLRGVVVWDSLSSSQVPAGQEFLTRVAPAVTSS